jgi:hypothetical protein
MPIEPELKTPEAPRPTLATLPSTATPAKTTPPMTSKKRTPKAPNAPDPPMDADPPIEDSEIEACPREGRQATSVKAIIKRVPFLWNSL